MHKMLNLALIGFLATFILSYIFRLFGAKFLFIFLIPSGLLIAGFSYLFSPLRNTESLRNGILLLSISVISLLLLNSLFWNDSGSNFINNFFGPFQTTSISGNWEHKNYITDIKYNKKLLPLFLFVGWGVCIRKKSSPIAFLYVTILALIFSTIV